MTMTQSRHLNRVHRMLVMSLWALPAPATSHAVAQRAYDRPPVVKEGTTVRISPRVILRPKTVSVAISLAM